jgi:TolB-like protein/DNA-binding winged helix-turn-helix (wHTH) protein/tetratricopeptide (TPR) repeat protein
MENPGPAHKAIRFGVFEIDPQAGELRKFGVKLKLQDQPFQVLMTMLDKPGMVVTREELRKKLWDTDTFVDFEHSLGTAINKIREALGDSADNPRFIETLPRRGYRFLGTVEAVDPHGALPAAAPSPARRRVPWALASGLVLALIAVLLLWFNVDKLRTRIFAKSRSLEIRSIAVLPLENLSKDPNQDYFSDGITDALTTELAQISSLRVISRTSAMHFRGTHETLPEIGRELSVDAVVEGSITRSENRVRITAQLIEAPSDRHLWAKSYERDLKDVLTLQDEVTRDIAEEIRVKLTPEERTRLATVRPVDPAAHEDYLRGRFFWNLRTEKDLTKAKEYFEQAIARDPNYAPAYSGLSDTYFYLGYAWGHMPPLEAMPLAKAAALKALELDEKLAEAHTSLGTVKFTYDWDFAGAEPEFKRALALNSNYANTHQVYSVLLGALGRPDESLAQIRKGAEVDPLSVPIRNMLVASLASSHRCDEAMEEDRKTLELDPNATHLAMLHDTMTDCYKNKGLNKEAFEEEVQARIARGETPKQIDEFRKTFAVSGRRGVLLKDQKIALAQWEKGHWHRDAFEIAMRYSELGDMDEAFAWIDKAIQLHSTTLFWLYVGDNPFQHDPRFAEVKRKMGVQN